MSRNLLSLGAAQALTFGAAALLQIYLARALGSEEFGKLAFVQGVAGLFLWVAHYNLTPLLARRSARDEAGAPHLVRLGLVTMVGPALLAGGLTAAYAALRDGRVDVVYAAALGGLALGLHGLWLVPDAVLQGRRRSEVTVPSVVVGQGVLLVATVLLVESGGGLVAVFGARMLGWGLGLLLLVVAARRVLGPGTPVSAGEIGGLLHAGRPFALNMLFAAIYMTSDVLVIREFHPDRELGLYRAAALVVLQLPVVAHVLNKDAYPRLAAALGDRALAGHELSMVVRWLLLLGVPVAIGGLVVAEPAVVWVYGESYREAWVLLAVMLPMVPLRFVNTALASALSALDEQPRRTGVVALAAAVNLVANLAVVPRWGALGAACTTLATEVLLVVGYRLALSRRVAAVHLERTLLRSVAAAALMAVVVGVAPGHVAGRILLGAGVYGALLWGLGWVRREDLSGLARP